MLMLIISTLNVSASTHTESFDFEALFIESYSRLSKLRYDMMYISCKYLDLEYDSEHDIFHFKDDIKVMQSYDPRDKGQAIYEYTSDSKGVSYEEKYDTPPGWVVEYYRVVDERFDTLEECSKYVTDIFANNIFDEIMYLKSSDKRAIELFRPSEGGMEYGAMGAPPFPSNPGYIAICRYVEGYNYVVLTDIGDVSVNGNTAVMNVKYSDNATDLTKDATVEFVNTPEGWRVSGGSFIAALLRADTLPEYTGEYAKEPESVPNPGTFDNTIMYFTIGAVALSGIVILFPKKKRT